MLTFKRLKPFSKCLTEGIAAVCCGTAVKIKINHVINCYISNMATRISVLLAIILLHTQVALADFSEDIETAALERTIHQVRYDGAYRVIRYPGGDVPPDTGVCTDVVIRTYRALGTDLQTLVHEDMAGNFHLYPSERIWGLHEPDPNIDHRRVPNLQVFFARHGERLAVSRNPADYKTGDLVTWMLPGNLPHIGIVTGRKSANTGNPLIVHNIGAGPKLEDMLFDFEITGHYRFVPGNYDGER